MTTVLVVLVVLLVVGAELAAQTTGRFHRNGHGDLHASQEAERP